MTALCKFFELNMEYEFRPCTNICSGSLNLLTSGINYYTDCYQQREKGPKHCWRPLWYHWNT